MSDNTLIRSKLVAAAARRGVPVITIARNLDVSRQRVEQLLDFYEGQFGPIERIKRHRKGLRQTWFCHRCGAARWEEPGVVNQMKKKKQRYCANCWVEVETVMTPERVRQAIEMRWNGQTWKGIGKIFGCWQQTVQKAIWKYLAREEMLDDDWVLSIWDPISLQRDRGNLREPAWNWLITATGLHPSNPTK